MEGFEAMLRGVCWKDACEEGEDEPLQDLAGRAEEGDRAVGLAVVRVFVRFWDGDDDGTFPYCRDGGGSDRVCENIAEESNASLAEVFEMEQRDLVRAFSG